MAQPNVLLGKLLIGVLGLIFGLFAISCRPLFQIPARHFYFGSLTALFLSRVALFTILFGVLNLAAESDVLLYYQQAKSALGGHLPYTQVQSSYAPLFGYCAALAVAIWDSPKAIIFMSILFELAATAIWAKVGRVVFGDANCRRAVIWYLASALPMINIGVDGQNQIWIGLFLGLAVYLLVSNKELLSGLCFGASLAVVKFLPAIFAPAYFAASRNRLYWIIGAAALPIIVYGCFAILGADLLMPVRTEGADSTSGNIPFLITFFSPSSLSSVFFVLVTLLALACVFLTAVRHPFRPLPPSALIYVIVLIQLTLLLFSKKAYTNYLAMTFFAICLAISTTARGRLTFVLFSLFGIVAALESSLWFRWFNCQQLHFWWFIRPPSGVSQLHLVIFIICELVLIAFYAVYAVMCWKKARAAIKTEAVGQLHAEVA